MVAVNASVGAAISETSPLLGDREAGQRSNGTANANGTAVSAASGAGEEEPERLGNPEMAKKMHLFLPAVGVGLYLVAVDQLLTVAIYAKIGSELKSLNNISWIITSYFLTLTSFQPLYGKLSDIFGRKQCLLFAYAIFGIGCLGCGLSRDMTQLCISRAVAGIGGGGMNAVVSILLSDIVPLRERGVWQGYLNIIFAAGTSTGAPLGGLLADSIGWRWSFLGQAPLCVVAWIAVYFVLDVPTPPHDHILSKIRRIDFLGAFTLVLAVVALLVGLDNGSNMGWSTTATIVPLAIAPALFAIFVFVEVKVAAEPFAPGHIIFHSSLFAGYLVNFFGSACQFAMFFPIPLYFQAVQSFSATTSGLLLVPGMMCAVVASITGGWAIKRMGKFYVITIASYAVNLVGAALLEGAFWYKTTAGELASMMINALGLGSGITTALVGLLANASTEDTAVVVACSYLFRSLGSSIGTSISSAVLQQTLRAQLASRLDGDQAHEIEERVRESIEFIKELPPKVADQVRLSYQMSAMTAIAPAVFFAAAAFLATFWVREKSLKR